MEPLLQNNILRTHFFPAKEDLFSFTEQQSPLLPYVRSRSETGSRPSDRAQTLARDRRFLSGFEVLLDFLCLSAFRPVWIEEILEHDARFFAQTVGRRSRRRHILSVPTRKFRSRL